MAEGSRRACEGRGLSTGQGKRAKGVARIGMGSRTAAWRGETVGRAASHNGRQMRPATAAPGQAVAAATAAAAPLPRLPTPAPSGAHIDSRLLRPAPQAGRLPTRLQFVRLTLRSEGRESAASPHWTGRLRQQRGGANQAGRCMCQQPSTDIH